MTWLPLARVLAFSGAAVLMAASPVGAQIIPSRIRARPPYQPVVPPATQAAPAAQPAAVTLSKEPFVSAPVNATPATSLLQQPAKEAQVSFADQRLSIHAENASLTAILHEVASKSGMHITGLANDERVFGTFGPGRPSDVLDDLLNGTAYNLMLLGDLANGAPRELILTQATRSGGEAPSPVGAAATQGNSADDSAGDQDNQEVSQQAPPDVPPPPPTSPGVRTPQQLFEQLQQMRQAQQQGLNPTQEQQSTQPPIPAAQQQ